MPRLSKWVGYIVQYLIFPFWVHRQLRGVAKDSLFVFCDQALGPWVPLVKDRPHIVHVHDLLALRSALGDIPENQTSITGRIYQRYIRRGFQSAHHFISVSKKTHEDLLRFGKVRPKTSEVVYNGLSFPYAPLTKGEAEQILRSEGLSVWPNGMLLYVGGDQWYKNMPGLLALYSHYAASRETSLPLWCVSPNPGTELRRIIDQIPRGGRVEFLQELSNRTLQAVYSCARALIFPSLAEGFGWPIIEAQACGCPVITTDEPPMNEIAGPAAWYIPRLRFGEDRSAWAIIGAATLNHLLCTDPLALARRIENGKTWAQGFRADRAIERYLAIYRSILAETNQRCQAH